MANVGKALGCIYVATDTNILGNDGMTVHEIPILRETEKQIHVDRPYVFGCKTVLNKSEVTFYRTRKEAIEAFIAKMKTQRDGLEKRIAKTDAMIAEALDKIGSEDNDGSE